ncbi:hypothetical protein AAL_04215 [Moelleriella libera RCEF 2490]|uniref:Uncharacterized protein n=1 Tax=Moelleriella libera RCEF 2490 TaxID=1081109 RepID=A0A168BYP5_9HYPO|nr:hypothetical protein AAL_04215 [Moelleriella libera RCEF 2490]
MPGDEFRKVGRGGAGNFHPVKTEAKQTQPPSEGDLERQQQQQQHSSDATTSPQSSTVVVAAPPALPGSRDLHHLAMEMKSAVTSSLRRNPVRMGGRGGAGNWAGESSSSNNDNDNGSGEADGDEAAALEKRVLETVDRGLQMPARAHHGRDKMVSKDGGS